MINTKGSITLLAIYICSFVLLLAILVKAIFLENYTYYNEQLQNNLFLIESKMVKDIYDDYKDVQKRGKNFSYTTTSIQQKSLDEAESILKLRLVLNKKIYTYEVEYDSICKQIINLTDTTIISKD